MTKTLFDPCPAGWRVPRSGDEVTQTEHNPWRYFTMENSQWNGAVSGPTAGRTYGAVVYGGNGTCWYPAAGGRNQYAGMLPWSGYWCHNWSTTITTRYWILRSIAGMVDTGGDFNYRALGYSVRCVRE
ncbi:MAG: hypothetical protein LIO68_01195 [Rikenellaceae bacterium]|nr:hypothetical protein [Rikenellaceae bacterium]